MDWSCSDAVQLPNRCVLAVQNKPQLGIKNLFGLSGFRSAVSQSLLPQCKYNSSSSKGSGDAQRICTSQLCHCRTPEHTKGQKPIEEVKALSRCSLCTSFCMLRVVFKLSGCLDPTSRTICLILSILLQLSRNVLPCSYVQEVLTGVKGGRKGSGA